MSVPEGFSKSKEELMEKLGSQLADITRPVTIDEIADVLNSTVRRDTPNKKVTFLAGLLTYTAVDQINISFTAESSSGKSYIPIELSWYFPKKDILEYSYVSPTAFFHEYGTMIDDPTDPEGKRKIIVIDLERKILIFLDQPHSMLLERLRPLLSHDRQTLISKITDRREKAGLRTKSVMIKGFPTVLFCTAKFMQEEQERTRLLLLSPDTTQNKIRDGILLKIEKDSDRQAFAKYMESDPGRIWLRERVEAIAQSGVRYIQIPEELRAKIADEFLGKRKNLIPRHMRDITRLLAMIKAHALLNLWHRTRVEDQIIVNDDDVIEGFRLYEQIGEANELGLPPEVFHIYQVITPLIPENGVTRRELNALYYKLFSRTMGSKRLQELLNLLFSVGLWTEEPDPNDKRLKRILPTGRGGYSLEPSAEGIENGLKLYTPEGVGDT